MGHEKESPPVVRGAGENTSNSTIRKPDNTTGYWVVPRLTRRAKAKLKRLRPWNHFLTVVQPAPDFFPGAVKTPRCRFCGQPHFFLGWVAAGDPGIRALPCKPEERFTEWQIPPVATTTVLARSA